MNSAREIVRKRGDQISVDALVAQVLPKARESVPESVRNSALARVRKKINQ